ncbi:DUF1961 family protein [Marinicrinis lubricantis]|uniref:DUF1961 family protein n=1 Tax=Marinicrinis lubricantis TaxID=2086470 RepID=A0ABW1IKX0_9BACL
MDKPSLIPEGWMLRYENALANAEDVKSFRMEGDGAVTFPLKRMRLESVRSPEEGQAANLVFWAPYECGDDYAVSWEFLPIREPGLAILFFSARGDKGQDLFDPLLAPRAGIYDQYHHGDINAYHLSYFRRMWPEERQFHTCNLRKSYGFHLVTQGADPIPGTADCLQPYRLLLIKQGGHIQFRINELPVLDWTDDGTEFGSVLGGGKLGFRQMAPLIAEYSNLQVYSP